MSRRLRGIDVKATLADRVVEWFDPVRAQQRLKARAMMAAAGSWLGGNTSRRATKNWNPKNGSADQDLLWDLPTMRDRSRDQLRNNPLALGAINTAVTSAIGTGLSLNAQPDAAALGWTDEQAEAWATGVESEFRAWAANPRACDAAKTLDFYRQQALAFRACLEAGDVFALLPMIAEPGQVYQTRVHMIEADRVGNESGAQDSDTLAGGIRKDQYGAPVEYHIMRHHPGGYSAGKREWDKVPAFGAQTGRRNVLHVFDPRRPGQSRGYPYLAPVIEPLKQLQTYTEAEITAAVISGMFTVFIKTESGDGLDVGAGNSGSNGGDDITMGNGAIVDLAKGEDVQFANPGRPNQAFDPFVQAILRQIGVGLEIPFELLIKHFTSSYSAARAALLEAWRFFKGRRAFMAAVFCQPIYEAWFEEAVALGRIAAPGFFADPALRAAYLGAEWIGDAPGQIDPLKEIDAAVKRIDADLSNHNIETMALHGMPWEPVHKRLARENAMKRADGTMPPDKQPAQPGGQPDDTPDGSGDDSQDNEADAKMQALLGAVIEGQASVAAAIAAAPAPVVNHTIQLPESMHVTVADMADSVRESGEKTAAAIVASAEATRDAVQALAGAQEVAQAEAANAQQNVLGKLGDVIAAVKAPRVTEKQVTERDADGRIKAVRQVDKPQD